MADDLDRYWTGKPIRWRVPAPGPMDDFDQAALDSWMQTAPADEVAAWLAGEPDQETTWTVTDWSAPDPEGAE